ncbi:MAG: hypothetical protein CMJ19_10885 [Phycisphaeraceae bacterium]|nr:hypothetical protein [Phycisphaeraceae bacterium]
MAASLKEIANAAGVSVATAARFLNGDQKEVWVSTARRAQRVRDIAKQMGYRPSHRAKSLARKSSMAVGLLYGRQSFFLADLYHRINCRISEQLSLNGYDLMMIPAVGPASQWSGKLMDGRIDACIVCDPAPADLQSVLDEVDLPMIGINLSTDAKIPMIRYDEAQGARLMMEHLLALGHRRFWMASYTETVERALRHMSFVVRIDTIKAILAEHNLNDNFEFKTKTTPRQFHAIASMPVHQRPTAIIAQNDARAMEVIRHLHDAGLRVPEDISVVGFNNDNSSALFIPSITSIDLPAQEASDQAVKYVLESLQNKQQKIKTKAQTINTVLDEQLIIRQSTGQARNE